MILCQTYEVCRNSPKAPGQGQPVQLMVHFGGHRKNHVAWDVPPNRGTEGWRRGWNKPDSNLFRNEAVTQGNVQTVGDKACGAFESSQVARRGTGQSRHPHHTSSGCYRHCARIHGWMRFVSGPLEESSILWAQWMHGCGAPKIEFVRSQQKVQSDGV